MSDTDLAAIPLDAVAPTKPPLPYGLQKEEAWARSLLKGFKPKRPVRQIVETLLAQEPQPPNAAAILLRSLRYPRPYGRYEQWLAAWALGWIELNKAEREQVRLHLESVVATWKGKAVSGLLKRSLLGGSGMTFVVLVSILASVGIWPTDPFSRLLGLISILLVMTGVLSCVILAGLAVFEKERSYQVRYYAANALGNLGQVQSIPVIAQAVVKEFRSLGNAAPAKPDYVKSTLPWTLRRLMVRLSPVHYQRLPAQTVPSLCRVLDQCRYASTERLAVEVLQALNKIGDGSAVASVERQAKNGITEKIRQQATAVLPNLQERKQRENATTMLLRASGAAAPETLLRATQEASDTRSQELLRPGEANESE